MKAPKQMSLPLDVFVSPVGAAKDHILWNPRDVESYASLAMQEDLRARGQITYGVALKLDATHYRILQGNRRFVNIEAVNKAGGVDPTTNKPFEFKAQVYESLSDQEIADFVLDQSTIKNLSRAEFQHALEMGIATWGGDDRSLYVRFRGSIETFWKPKALKEGKEPHTQYHGRFQMARRIADSPIVMHDAIMEQLRGKQNWPTEAAIIEGVKIFKDEQNSPTDNPLAKISRSEPGPKFLEWWSKQLQVVAEAEAVGRAPKSASMRNRAATLKTFGSAKSRALRIVMACQLDSTKELQLSQADQALFELETGTISPDQFSKALDKIMESVTESPVDAAKEAPATGELVPA